MNEKKIKLRIIREITDFIDKCNSNDGYIYRVFENDDINEKIKLEIISKKYMDSRGVCVRKYIDKDNDEIIKIELVDENHMKIEWECDGELKDGKI